MIKLEKLDSWTNTNENKKYKGKWRGCLLSVFSLIIGEVNKEIKHILWWIPIHWKKRRLRDVVSTDIITAVTMLTLVIAIFTVFIATIGDITIVV